MASGGKALSVAGFLAPGPTDKLMARLLLPAMHSGRPPHGHGALDGPTHELREAGEYAGLVRGSVYTALTTHPRMRRMLAIGLTLLPGSVLAHRRSNAQSRRHIPSEHAP